MNDDLDLFDSTNTNRFPDTVDISQNKLENKATEIQKYISEFEYRLRGYEWDANGDKMIYRGNALTGEKVIQKLLILLQPFSKEIILISNKSTNDWIMQLWRTCTQANRILLKEVESIANNYLEILIPFVNLMLNIGDIVCNNNSQDFMSKILGYYDKPKDEVKTDV